MSRWIEKKDGWHKNTKSTEKGNAEYFQQKPPPVRDANGFPLKPNSGGKIDWNKVYEERNGKE